MKTNKSLRLLPVIVGGALLNLITLTANAAVEYKISLAQDNQTYEVWMKPSATPKPDISLTGQVTIKVPHNSNFEVNALQSTIENASWVEASRVNAPQEDPSSDYISFSFVGSQGNSAHNYGWQQDKEQMIFSFANKTGCISGVHLMPHDDPFNTEPNSANTNPGNQFTNLGWGSVNDNHYTGNYSESITCQ